jgi:hypothetical protein
MSDEGFTITNSKTEAAEVLIYNDINSATSGPFVRALNELKADAITVRAL